MGFIISTSYEENLGIEPIEFHFDQISVYILALELGEYHQARTKLSLLSFEIHFKVFLDFVNSSSKTFAVSYQVDHAEMILHASF